MTPTRKDQYISRNKSKVNVWICPDVKPQALLEEELAERRQGKLLMN